MAKNQRNYTNEFKQQMVDLYNKSRKSVVGLSGEYGLPKSTLHKWIKNTYSQNKIEVIK
ncbi:MAG: transposase [Clostridia bacterium]|nr:transposase [Clostridia bacterium]